MSPISVRVVHSPRCALFLICHPAVDVIRNNMAARQNDLRLYLDVISDHGKVRAKMKSANRQYVADSCCSARTTLWLHHDLPQALRHLQTNVIRCWEGVCRAKLESRRLGPNHQRKNAVDARDASQTLRGNFHALGSLKVDLTVRS